MYVPRADYLVLDNPSGAYLWEKVVFCLSIVMGLSVLPTSSQIMAQRLIIDYESLPKPIHLTSW